MEEPIYLGEYFRRINKVETKKPDKLKYSFDNDRFICSVDIERGKQLVKLYIKAQTGYGYVLDKKTQIINKEQDLEYTIKKIFVDILRNS